MNTQIASIEIFDNSLGSQYYILGGHRFDINFPIKWAVENLNENENDENIQVGPVVGPVHCGNCATFGVINNVFSSLESNYIIVGTHMGDEFRETKIILTKEDNENHFVWCWNKMVDDFRKENIIIDEYGEHRDYFISFFNDSFLKAILPKR